MAGNEMDLLKQATQKMMARYEYRTAPFSWVESGTKSGETKASQIIIYFDFQPHAMFRTSKAFAENLF